LRRHGNGRSPGSPDAATTELIMSNVTELIDRYIAMWNETDAERRRDLIAKTWTKTGSYLDPVMQGEGPAGLDAMVRGVQERFPGHKFRRTSEVDSHHDRIRFAWELAADGGLAVVGGTDFGILSEGRLQAITGFFDQAPAAQ
jgi:hypothetical protein